MRQRKMSMGSPSDAGAEVRQDRSAAAEEKPNPAPVRKWKKWKIDNGVLIPLLILIGIGMLMVFSANTYTSVQTQSGYMVFIKQVVFILAGLLIMWFVSRLNYRALNNMKLAWGLMGLSLLLLVLVFFIGVEEEESHAVRWLSLGFTTFQPSELAKLTGCIYMAATVSHHPEVTEKWLPFFLRGILPVAVICILIYLEPSLSAAVAVAVPMLVILFLSIKSLKLLLPYGVLAAGLFVYVIKNTSWRLDRIQALFGSGENAYQIKQSLLAIGSGGVLGKGFGNGIQKYLFLSQLENDFIFANIGEELGLLGCLFVLGLFTVLVYRGLRQAMQAKDAFGFYYTAGIMVLIGFQAVVNIGVATGVLPVTGMVLPFVSAGGTSLLVFCVMMGVVLNVTRQTQYRTGLLNRRLKQ